MSAPERIWAGNAGPDLGDTWADEPEAGWSEYIRADTVAATHDPAKVQALVKAAKLGLKDLSAWLAVPHVGEMFNTDMTHFAVQELTAALRAIGEGEA